VQRFQLVHPAGVAAAGLRRLGGRHAKALQVDQPADTRRSHTGVQHGDVAAHAVAHQIDRERTRVVVEQEIEVGQVIGKPVVVGSGRFAEAKAAPVGRDDVAWRGQRIDHELVGGRHVHPAVHQHQRRHAGLRLAPHPDVVTQIADGDEFAARRVPGLVHGRDDRQAGARVQS